MSQLVQENLTGFLVGLASSAVAGIILFGISWASERRKNARYKGFVGTYYGHHFASTQDQSLIVTTLNISYRFGKLRVEAHEPPYKYLGTMVVSSSNIYIRLDGSDHTELVQYVFATPAAFNVQRPLIGVAASVNPINEPYVQLHVLSTTNLEADTVRRYFDSDHVARTNYNFMVKSDLELFGSVAYATENTDSELNEPTADG